MSPATEQRTQDWREFALEALKRAGYRSGGGRRQVVDLLASQGCALTALEIDRRLEGVGRATVYRALDQLEDLGLIQRVGALGDVAGYEKVEPSGHHHHHIVCDECGKVVPFEDKGLEQALEVISRRSDFKVSGHDVTLHGRCPKH